MMQAQGSRSLGRSAFLPDWSAGDDEVIQVEVDILLGDGLLAAVVDVDPDLLDLERIDVTEPEIGPLECRGAVDPAAQDAVVAARGVELAVHLDAIPAAVLQAGDEDQVIAVLPPHVGVVAVEADGRVVAPVPAHIQPSRRPTVAPVDLAPAPAGPAVSAADPRQLAPRRGIRPIAVEPQVVLEVDLLGLGADPVAELVDEARPVMVAAPDGHAQALPLAAVGFIALDPFGVLRG